MRCTALAAALLLLLGSGARGDELRVGVSWSNFQEERWKTDETALRDALSRRGARYLATDAQSSTEKQLADVESLVTRGVDALVIVAQDADAIGPAVALARAEGIPVIAYDRLIEAPGVFYLSFDNREVGRVQARSVQAVQPTGRYVFIKGSPVDPNTFFVHDGQLDVLQPAIDDGRIQVVGEDFIENWQPQVAQRTMEQILTATSNGVDAVVCSNDGMAAGVVAALRAQGMEGIPVSGQDGERAALNRVARGQQTVSVWKDSRSLGERAATLALALAEGTAPASIPGRATFAGGPRKVPVDAVLLKPVPITRDNLHVVIEAGWIERDVLCRGTRGDPPAACRTP